MTDSPTVPQPCPVCGGEVSLAAGSGGGGASGQMFTLVAIASCDECQTIFRDSAPNTAGFRRHEIPGRWRDFVSWTAAVKARRPACAGTGFIDCKEEEDGDL